eukprot:1699985-Prymnesium_polylepis.1
MQEQLDKMRPHEMRTGAPKLQLRAPGGQYVKISPPSDVQNFQKMLAATLKGVRPPKAVHLPKLYRVCHSNSKLVKFLGQPVHDPDRSSSEFT